MTRRIRAAITAAIGAVCLGLAACAATGPVTAPTASRAPEAAKSPTAQRARPEFPGFRHVVRNNTDYFCQSRSPTGSRARMGERCFTRDEMKAMEENNEELFKNAAGGSSHDSLKMDSPR